MSVPYGSGRRRSTSGHATKTSRSRAVPRACPAERRLSRIAALSGRAFQILEWDRNHRYCSRCGTRMDERGDERSRTCGACGLKSYPPVTPAVNASKAKRAIAKQVRKRVPAHAKLKLTGCKPSGAARYRCNVKATRRGLVWFKQLMSPHRRSRTMSRRFFGASQRANANIPRKCRRQSVPYAL